MLNGDASVGQSVFVYGPIGCTWRDNKADDGIHQVITINVTLMNYENLFKYPEIDAKCGTRHALMGRFIKMLLTHYGIYINLQPFVLNIYCSWC